MNPMILTGQRFGKLVVGERFYPNLSGKHVRWRCVCDCGAESIATTTHLRQGHTTSCGCEAIRRSRETSIKHGRTSTAEYRTWCHIKSRCYNPNVPEYRIYGARGIRMCDRWRRDFAAFFADMGPRPSANHSIDRIDNDGPYEPRNCRWATRTEQNNNTRTNHFVRYRGQRVTLAQVCRSAGINYHRFKRLHVKRGLPVEEAVEEARRMESR